MWLYLKTGFYSVVHKPPCKKNEIMVRTRSKLDIEKLKKHLKENYEFDSIVMETPKADYAYRMIVDKNIFAAFLVDAAMNLDYDNFKNTIPRIDYKRHDAYMKCWEAMYEWQADLTREKGRK